LSRRSRCSKSTCSNAPRGQKFARSCTSKFARSCTSVSQPARSSRTQRCCQGGRRSAADRHFDVGRTTRGLPGSPALADTHRAPASRVLPTGITAHSFPGNILGAPGSGARRGLRRNNVATRPGPTKRPAPKNRWACCVTCRPVILADLHPHASPCAACRPHTEQVRREHVATLPAVAGGVGRHGCAEQQ